MGPSPKKVAPQIVIDDHDSSGAVSATEMEALLRSSQPALTPSSWKDAFKRPAAASILAKPAAASKSSSRKLFYSSCYHRHLSGLRHLSPAVARRIARERTGIDVERHFSQS